MSENDRPPGWPYFLAALFIVCAYRSAKDLPNQQNQFTFYTGAKSKMNEHIGEEYAGLIDEREQVDLGR